MGSHSTPNGHESKIKKMVLLPISWSKGARFERVKGAFGEDRNHAVAIEKGDHLTRCRVKVKEILRVRVIGRDVREGEGMLPIRCFWGLKKLV